MIVSGRITFTLSVFTGNHLLRSLHTESEIIVRIFCILKNKYDLKLCQSRLDQVCYVCVLIFEQAFCQ